MLDFVNEKPVKLPMDFGEALTRLARTPKAAIDAVADKLDTKDRKAKASRSPPSAISWECEPCSTTSRNGLPAGCARQSKGWPKLRLMIGKLGQSLLALEIREVEDQLEIYANAD